MSAELPKNIPELYRQFGNARQKVVRYSTPFLVAAAVNLGIGAYALFAGNKEQQSAYARFGPPLAFATAGPALLVGTLGEEEHNRQQAVLP